MRGLLFAIMLSACAAALAGTTVYVWVDAQGVTHYSDQPHQGATKMKVEDAPTYASTPVGGAGTGAPNRAAGEQKMECPIVSPTDQQMFMNAWSVSGHVQVPKGPGYRVVLMLDGTVLPNAADGGGNFTLPQVDRGQHTLAAQVLDQSGQVVCESPSVTFFVHQPNLDSPTNQSQGTPIRPRS
jgi:hypothetical protein